MTTTLNERVSRRSTVILIVLAAVINLILIGGLFVTSTKLVQRQADIWIRTMPQSLLPHLLDSDHFSISSKMELVESTGLFEAFQVFDQEKNFIAGFPSRDQPPPSLMLPIRDSSDVLWGYYAYELDTLKPVKPILPWISLPVLLLLMSVILSLRMMRRQVDREFDVLRQFVEEVNLICDWAIEGLAAPQSNLKNIPSQELDLLRRSIDRLVSAIRREQDVARRAVVEYQRVKALEELSQVALQVAHDIRSPLMALQVISKDLSSTQEESKTLLAQSISRIRGVADQLLDLARQKKREIQDQSKVLDLGEILSAIVWEKKLQKFESKEIEWELKLPKGKAVLSKSISETDLLRIFSNLLDNSIEAISEKGTIKISVEEADQFIRVQVVDSGSGISSEVLSRIGERGFTFGKQNGNGLGVAFAKQRMESCGGKLVIQSEPNKGTTIELSIPGAIVSEESVGS